MIEITGDLFKQTNASVIVITTNGVVRNDGRAVMGAGVAKQAVQMFPSCASLLGRSIKNHGNVVRHFADFNMRISRELLRVIPFVSFPVKHHWSDRADIQLIKESAYDLHMLGRMRGWRFVAMPRPGCGNGRLDWETEVKPLIAPILSSDRFVIVELTPDG